MRRLTTIKTVLIFILGVFYALPVSEAPAQDRENRERKTKDFFGPRFEFHAHRPTRGERRHPIEIIRFRSIDGMNNNPIINNFGATGVNLRRRVPSAYIDNHGPSGQDRPNPREISNLVCNQVDSIPNSRMLSSMVWQWGQFLDHDIVLTESAIPSESLPIEVPAGDVFFDPFQTGVMEIPFSRSEYRRRFSGRPREQVNSISSWIDGSNVYGSDIETADSLRTFQGGLMRTSAGDLLPIDEYGFFMAGDIRANEQSCLICMHTLFVREHNRIARKISRLNPRFTDQQVYLRARQRVVAIIQSITYNEFLPALLGPEAIRPYRDYRPNVNPNISNIFATAAYRFGHSMLNPEIWRMNNDLSPIADGHLTLREAFFNPNEIKMHGIDPYLKGLTMQPSQEVDTLLIDDVRNFLFGPPGSGGFDLASLNIQRGRDHGLPNYNTVRTFFRLPPVSSVEQITDDTETQIALLQAYGNVNSIDPWIGMLAEDHVPGASVGPTLHRIISQQFEMLRDADRFWYQLLFRGKDLAGIESTKLSNVIYRNTEVRFMQRNVFVTPLGQ